MCDLGPVGRSHGRCEVDDGGVERGSYDAMPGGLRRLISCQGVVDFRGGREELELVIPAPVDDTGTVPA